MQEVYCVYTRYASKLRPLECSLCILFQTNTCIAILHSSFVFLTSYARKLNSNSSFIRGIEASHRSQVNLKYRAQNLSSAGKPRYAFMKTLHSKAANACEQYAHTAGTTLHRSIVPVFY